MKNLLLPKEQPLATAIGLLPALVILIIWYLYKRLLKILWKTKKQLYHGSLIILAFYGLVAFFGPVIAHAPYANASETYTPQFNVSLPMKVNPDMKTREIVLSLVKVEFGEDQVQAFDNIVIHESGWDPKAVNPNGGACGLFQALPCSKMKSTNLEDQIAFGLGYIKARYGTPNQAWAFWKEHNWY